MATKMSIQKIWTRGGHEGFTPYMIHSLVNAALVAEGLAEVERPQMMYNYDSNGLINGTKRQNAERGYTTDEVIAFIERFVDMRAKKAQKAQKAQKATPQIQSSFTIEDVESVKEYLSETNPTLI